jgi:Eukaryotic protein of unknown function (DUF829)
MENAVEQRRFPHHQSVVVLIGWLGSKPKSLNRYELLYRQLGIPIVLTYIAPPYTIVKTALSPVEPIHIPKEWPNESCKNILTVQDVAWNILKSVYDEKCCERCFVHAFSNGGCFVWEKIRQILLLIPIEKQNQIYNDSNDDYIGGSLKSQEIVSILQRLRRQLRGVVFDSCPIADLYRLPDALQYCSIMERTQVIQHCGFEYLTILTNIKVKEKVQERIKSYIHGLQSDPLLIHQLYIYGGDDPLAPASFIDEIIQQRKQIMNAESIMVCSWEKSQHCGHLLRHRFDYTKAIDQFLHGHQTENRITARSKL